MKKNHQLVLTEDGSHTVISPEFGVSYHSLHGAIAESMHVFVRAGLDRAIDQKKSKISILEMGFGTGLNTLLSYHHILQKHPEISLTYTAIEAYPISAKEIGTLNYTDILNSAKLRSFFQKIHSDPWNTPISHGTHFTLEKQLVKIQDLETNQKFDVIYYDAFAPNNQEELWNDSMMAKMYSLLHKDGCLVSYCAKGSFKRSLKKVGFHLESLPGPGKKREMSRAIKP